MEFPHQSQELSDGSGKDPEPRKDKREAVKYNEKSGSKIESSVVIGIKRCDEDEIEAQYDYPILGYMLPRYMSAFIADLKTPTVMGNTKLHLAASNGNDDVVDIVVKHAPELLFEFNQNRDTALHIAARAGHILTLVKLLHAYADHFTLLDWNDLLVFLREKNNQGNTMLHEALTLVSTLIITASVAACLAVPGEADGTAHNLHNAMFQFFIVFITISFFSSVSATIILFWARLGIAELVTGSLQFVMPLLGIALISLSLAFITGFYTVICKLTWLAIIFLVMTLILVVFVVLLCSLLFLLPSPSTNVILRYMSYYPYIALASLVVPETKQGINF